MPHDPGLKKRNLLVLPGGLLAFYSLFAIAYAEWVRPASATACGDGGLVLVSGACYTVWKAAVLLFLLGVLLMVIGWAAFRNRTVSIESCLYPGTGVHLTFAILLSLVLLALGAVLVFAVRQGLDNVLYTFEARGTTYQLVLLLEMALAVSLLAFLPFLGLLLHQRRMRARLFAILDEEGDLPVEERGRPRQEVRKAPLRDITGAEGAYVNLEDEKPAP